MGIEIVRMGLYAAVRMPRMLARELATAYSLLRMRSSTRSDLPRPKRVTGRRNRMLALALWNRDSGRCGRCGYPIYPGLDWRSPGALTIGHIQAHSRGGTYDPRNLRPEHRICNLAGGTGDPRPMPRIVEP